MQVKKIKKLKYFFNLKIFLILFLVSCGKKTTVESLRQRSSALSGDSDIVFEVKKEQKTGDIKKYSIHLNLKNIFLNDSNLNKEKSLDIQKN